ncbi:MAG TPA: hypothetical protein PK781_08225 [Terrimesophilobacter sp.]|nr:hypothetical protein [Terrimesophilobacter sp.]
MAPNTDDREFAAKPLGVPERVDENTLGRALTRGQQVGAATLLGLAVFVTLVMQTERPDHWFWAVGLAIVPLIVLLVARLSSPSSSLALAYLVFGGIVIFTLNLSTTELATGELTDAGLGLFAVRLALILCGAVGTSVSAGILWTALGYVTSEGAMIASSVALGTPYEFSLTMLLSALAVGLLRPIVGLVSPQVRTVWEQLQQASVDDYDAHQREQLEQRAAALVHDTVLGQLHTIATSPLGEISAVLRDQLVRNVDTVTSGTWIRSMHDRGRAASAEWQQTPLFAAVQDARLLGLSVDVTGDPAVLGRLDADTSLALALAAGQCLSNVLKHSGVRGAEVAIYGTDTDVCVMIIDAGNGFDEANTAADRLGLSTSVRRRIDSIGGRVHVWTTPGQGTSIMLRVPDAEHDTVASHNGVAADA